MTAAGIIWMVNHSQQCSDTDVIVVCYPAFTLTGNKSLTSTQFVFCGCVCGCLRCCLSGRVSA